MTEDAKDEIQQEAREPLHEGRYSVLTEDHKDELQEDARELLEKCRRLMTPGVIATLENLLDPAEWMFLGGRTWALRDSEAEEELREIQVLYFNDLIAPRRRPDIGLRYSR